MSEWSKTLLEAIDSVAEISTEKVVRPAHKAARVSVYGIVVGILVTIVVLSLVIALFRITTLAVPVYGAYLIWGAVFLIIGTLLWAKK